MNPYFLPHYGLGLFSCNRRFISKICLFFVVFLYGWHSVAAQTVDQVIFGNAASETAHTLSQNSTQVITGGLGETARQCLPLPTVGANGGDLTFTMQVDPVKRNYFTVRFWGEDDLSGTNGQASDKGRLYLYIPINGINYQVGYRHEGDYIALNVSASKPPLPGRFFYSTTLLPLSMTQGKTSLTLKIISTGRVYPLGSGLAPAGNYQFLMNTPGRGIYRAYTHTSPLLNPTGETQGSAPAVSVRPSPGEEVLQPGGSFYNSVNNRINNRLNATVSVSSFSPADVEYLARSYSLANLAGFQNQAVVAKVIAVIDAFTTDYYTNPTSVSGDWGGKYGALGRAIKLLGPQLQNSLEATAYYGTTGGNKARRQAWGDMLVASRDYGRLNRDGRAITNQGLIADESIYKANSGLLTMGDARALSEQAAQRYLLEAIGLSPWLGSDLSVTTGGSSRKFGSNYYMVTQKGLSREWGYVGLSYGEMQTYSATFYRYTGNPVFNDQAVKMLKARVNFRRPTVEVSNGTYYRSMEGIGLLAWRGAPESDGDYADAVAYGDRAGGKGSMRTAATSLDPSAVGYVKQMLADNQYFNSLGDLLINDVSTLDVFDDYQTVKNAPDSGIRVPMSDGQPDFAWADEEGGIVAIKRGDNRLWVAPYWQAKGGTGVNGVARFYYSTPQYDQYGVLETNPQFTYSGLFYARPNLTDKPEQNFFVPVDNPTQAYQGEKLPIAATELMTPPTTLTSDYDPFRGKVDFYAFRFGNYLIGLNVSLSKLSELRVPAGFTASPDLISGATVSGNTTVNPRSTVVLYLDSAVDATPVPTAPLLVLLAGTTASQTTLTWTAASDATGYTIKRSTTRNGIFSTIASGITSLTYTDATLSSGTTYFYKVTATNANGESYSSMVASTGTLAGNAPQITSTLSATGYIGSPFVYATAALYTPTSFNATGLPAGLSINTSNGLISGTPTSSGTFAIQLSATNGTGTTSATLTLTVATPSSPEITSPVSATGYKGVPFAYAVTATNTPASFGATGLPSGFSINASTGIISGTPTATGSYPITISATNAGGTTTATVTLIVIPPPAPEITSASLANGIVGFAFTYQIVATYAPASYSATNLPPGLTVNTLTGVISGTPTMAGSFSATLSATNEGGTGVATLLLGIPNPAPAPWVDSDIGVATGGYATFSANAFTVRGAGSDIGTTADGFNFLSQPVSCTGNVTIIARLASRVIGGSANDKVGIMIRESSVNNARHAWVFIDASSGKARFASRSAVGGNTTNVDGNTTTVPAWFKLERMATSTANSYSFTGYVSSDGVGWTQVGTATFSMTAVNVGMAVCSRDPSQLNTSTFDNVYVSTSCPVSQTIAFNNLPAKQAGDADFDPAATASSGLTVSYASSNTAVATILNGLIHIVGAGSTTITASQAGNASYSAAPDVIQSLTVTLPITMKIKYQDGDNGQVTNNNIKPNLTLVNEGTTDVPYSELTVRYWFTAENFAGINTWIDYAQLGNSKVRMKYVWVDQPRNNATGYIEYSFDASAGNLAVGGNSGPIQSRFANTDWSNLSETNDYSYQAFAGYAFNERITLYRNGTLIWGSEPEMVSPQVNLKVYSENKNSNTSSNTISTYLNINNEGNQPVAYEDVSVRYWFTAEGTQNLNAWIDYAQLGSSNVTTQFVRNIGRTNADTYFELKVNPAVGTLYPASSTGNIQYRIAKVDWSNFDETNDFSFKPAASFAENDHITIYYKGQLIYGTEPVSGARMATEFADSPLTLTVLENPVVNEQAEVDIRGALGKALNVVLTDLNGRPLLEQYVEQASEVQRQTIPLNHRAGVYLLRVRTDAKSATIKLMKP